MECLNVQSYNKKFEQTNLLVFFAASTYKQGGALPVTGNAPQLKRIITVVLYGEAVPRHYAHITTRGCIPHHRQAGWA